MAAPLVKAESVPGWGITDQVQQATDLLERSEAHGFKNPELFLRQGSLMGGEAPSYKPEIVALAKTLKSAKMGELVNASRSYASQAMQAAQDAEAGTDLFGNPPPAVDIPRAFRDTFGQLGAAGNTLNSGLFADGGPMLQKLKGLASDETGSLKLPKRSKLSTAEEAPDPLGLPKNTTWQMRHAVEWFAQNYPEVFKLARVEGLWKGARVPYYTQGRVNVPLDSALPVKDLISTLAHEFEHAAQSARGAVWAEPKAPAFENYQKYWNHPSEVEARQAGEAAQQKFLESLSPAQKRNALLGKPLDWIDPRSK